MKKLSAKHSRTSSKLKRAARVATREARRENKALGLKVLFAKKDGLYLTSSNGKEQLVKKGNYEPVKVASRLVKLGE